MHEHLSTDPSWSTALYSGRCLFFYSHFRANVGSSASPNNLADTQYFWCLSNTDVPAYVNGWVISLTLRWRSSEMEKKLSNRLGVSSFFEISHMDDLRSHNWSVRYPDWSGWFLNEGTCMGVRREVLRGVHQIQLGVWGALWAPQRGPGRSPGRFWN